MDAFEFIDIERLEGAGRRDVVVRLQKVELGIATDHDRFTLKVELRRQQLLDPPQSDSEGQQNAKKLNRAEKKRQKAAANRAAKRAANRAAERDAKLAAERAADARRHRAEAAKELAIRRSIEEVARDAAGPRRNLPAQEPIRSVVSGGLPSLGKF